MRVAIVTDSNSGISQAQAEELGIFVLPMPFTIDGKEYFEGINLTVEEFFQRLKEDCDISTSQPSPESVMNLWDRLLKEYDEIVHIPMSSGLSGSCQTAIMLAEDYDGKVQVVDNKRISVTMRSAVMDALTLAKEGKNAREIKEKLLEMGPKSTIYLTLDTLKYLKKGGRITPAAAAIGTILRLKPVLTIQGDKLDAFAKARTMKQAKEMMINAIAKDMKERFDDVTGETVTMAVVHTENMEAAELFRQELYDRFPGVKDICIDDLSLSVSCHIGPGCLAVTADKKMD